MRALSFRKPRRQPSPEVTPAPLREAKAAYRSAAFMLESLALGLTVFAVAVVAFAANHQPAAPIVCEVPNATASAGTETAAVAHDR